MPINKVAGQKKDGKEKYRVRVNYTDRYGKFKQVERTAYGLAEAKILESELLKELKNNSSSSNITIQELYDEYIERKEIDVRESTLNKSKSILKNNVLPFVKDIKLNKLTPNILMDWKLQVAKKGNGIRTNKNAYAEFRALLNYAVGMKYLPENPLTKIKNFNDAYEVNIKEKIQYYTSDEFKKYITYAKESAKTFIDYGSYVFFNIAYYTGMRKGEINALKWSDIDGNLINVRRSIAQKIKGGDRETPPKNKTSYRTIQMPIPLINILNEHKARQKQNFSNFTEDFRVCGGIRCLRDTTIAKKNIDYAEHTELHHIRIHDFRHSHATLLANARVNIQEISRRLGHANIEMTWNTYSHLYPQEEEKAIAILNEI